MALVDYTICTLSIFNMIRVDIRLGLVYKYTVVILFHNF